MPRQRARITEGGRLVSPAEFLRQMGLIPGESVLIDLRDGEVRVRSLRGAVEKAQALVHRYVPEGVSLSEELIRERHAEAERE